ncbi:PREDICTED: protein SYM1-like [Camelina sativa]|uniref:Protein SYM1-like n=1 Tax=Camelina sativa TaxID=90675 RepID=A0ABM0XS08_CAMSA|nr:PREDICTED: protein SYM1-like [Camelina sativa]
MDGLIFGPIDLLVFFTYMGYATGKNTAEVKEGLKRDFLPALALEGGAWPLLQIANFRYVPVQYQLLYVNIFCLVDSAFLSWVEQQKDAAWKQWFTSFQPLKERGGHGGDMAKEMSYDRLRVVLLVETLQTPQGMNNN